LRCRVFSRGDEHSFAQRVRGSRSPSPFVRWVGLVVDAGLGRSRQTQARGKLLRAYGALPADAIRTGVPARLAPVGYLMASSQAPI
jgi:hypothetical protein